MRAFSGVRPSSMWFKNLTLFRLAEPFSLSAEALAEKLAGSAFHPCGSYEPDTHGWVPPLGRRSAELVYAANGCLLLCLQSEEKVLPPAVVRDMVAAQVVEREEREQRTLLRREKEALRDEVWQALLPRALSRTRQQYAYIDPRGGWLAVDSAGRKAVEGLTGALRKTLGSLAIVPPRVAAAPKAVMTAWLAQGGLAADFQLTDECELRDGNEEGGVVRCKGQDLDGAEIEAHLQAGKQVTRLGLTWNEHLAFVLTEELAVRRLRFLDWFREQLEETETDTAEQVLATEFALISGEFQAFLPRLLEVFGGEAR